MANLLFILLICNICLFAGLVFVCVGSKVVYSMFQFFAVVLLLSSLISVGLQFNFFSPKFLRAVFLGKINKIRKQKKKMLLLSKAEKIDTKQI